MYDYVLQTLVNGDTWAFAVENAIGRLLNTFIVANHKDALVLRGCAREASYGHVPIVIYDFARPRWMHAYLFRVSSGACYLVFDCVSSLFDVLLTLCRLDIRPHMLPQTNHPTTLSVLQTENHIVYNVLVDMVTLHASSSALYDVYRLLINS